MKLVVREEAEDDVLAAALWYENCRAGLGGEFRNRLAAVYESIRFNPRQFGAITHRKVQGDVRMAFLKQFPYTVVFEVFDEQEEVVVYAVTDGRRNDPWLGRLGKSRNQP